MINVCTTFHHKAVHIFLVFMGGMKVYISNYKNIYVSMISV